MQAFFTAAVVTWRILPPAECPEHLVNRVFIICTSHTFINYPPYLVYIYYFILCIATFITSPYMVLCGRLRLLSMSHVLFRCLFLEPCFWVRTESLFCVICGLSALQNWAVILLAFCMASVCLSCILNLFLQGCAVLFYCPYQSKILFYCPYC